MIPIKTAYLSQFGFMVGKYNFTRLLQAFTVLSYEWIDIGMTKLMSNDWD